MDTDSFIIHINTEDFYEDIANVVGKWFDTSNYGEDYDRPLPRGMKKKKKKSVVLRTNEGRLW